MSNTWNHTTSWMQWSTNCMYNSYGVLYVASWEVEHRYVTVDAYMRHSIGSLLVRVMDWYLFRPRHHPSGFQTFPLKKKTFRYVIHAKFWPFCHGLSALNLKYISLKRMYFVLPCLIHWFQIDTHIYGHTDKQMQTDAGLKTKTVFGKNLHPQNQTYIIDRNSLQLCFHSTQIEGRVHCFTSRQSTSHLFVAEACQERSHAELFKHST